MNVRIIFSKHFITYEVKATGLKSFKSSADKDLGTGIMLESLYVDGTLNVCSDFLRRQGRSLLGPGALCSLSRLNYLLTSSVVTLNGGGGDASIG